MENGIYTVTNAEPRDDQSWLVNRFADGVRTVTLDLTTFIGGDNEDKYFASVSDTDTVSYLKSGIPLARITASGKYGPYDPEASDGRETGVAGLLESQLRIEWTRGGLKYKTFSVGMRYMAVIDKSKLPVDTGEAVFEGLFFDMPNGDNTAAGGPITPLSAAAGKAVASASVDTLAGATDTGRSLMKATDATAARTAIGAGTSNFSGSYNDLTSKPSIPPAPANATTAKAGLVKQATHVVDPAGETPTKAEFIALRNALVTAGQMAGA